MNTVNPVVLPYTALYYSNYHILHYTIQGSSATTRAMPRPYFDLHYPHKYTKLVSDTLSYLIEAGNF